MSGSLGGLPGVVGAAWAAQMREAREQYDAAKAAFESETLACLKGEGCPIQLETAEAALSAATARIDQINPFRERESIESKGEGAPSVAVDVHADRMRPSGWRFVPIILGEPRIAHDRLVACQNS